MLEQLTTDQVKGTRLGYFKALYNHDLLIVIIRFPKSRNMWIKILVLKFHRK